MINKYKSNQNPLRFIIIIQIVIILLFVKDNHFFVELIETPKSNDFFCFGNSNITDSEKFRRNEIYYPALPSTSKNSSRTVPEMCGGYLQGESNYQKKSCCFSDQVDQFNDILNTIENSIRGSLIECPSKNWMPLPTGFRNIDENGNTIDLITNDHPVLRVYDSRFHVKTCISQLRELQCYRCSQDHSTILREPEVFISPGGNKTPIFYKNANMTTYYEGDSETSYTIQVGKSLTLCSDYYTELEKFCNFIRVGDIPYGSYYSVPVKNQFQPDLSDSNRFISIASPKIFSKFLASQDYTDGLFVSNANCFKIPIPKYKDPICSFILNDTWINDYKSKTEKDINGAPINHKANDNGFFNEDNVNSAMGFKSGKFFHFILLVIFYNIINYNFL